MRSPGKRERKEVVRSQGYEIHIVGGNLVFAVAFLVGGGVANMAPGSFADAFFFSVQTMGTIGYGSMYPTSRLANVLVVAESVTGLVATTVATGLVFARFSQSRARVAFSSRVGIAPMDGVPTLMVRVGNERRNNQIVDTIFRLTLMRTTRTAEGVTVYRAEDLSLVRSRAPALARSWMILHAIAAASPLHGATPDQLASAEAELTVELIGTDDTSLQTMHARNTWMASGIVWGARLADVLTETPDGNMLLDLRRCHDLEPTEPTEAFPYKFAG